MKSFGSFDGFNYNENQRTIKVPTNDDASSINMNNRSNSNMDVYSWPSYNNKSNDINYKAMEFLRV